MAQSCFFDSGSVLVGSPIVLKIKSEDLLGKSSFHQVVVKVKTSVIEGTLSDSDENEVNVFISGEEELSLNCGDNEDVFIDISNAILSVFSGYEYKPIVSDCYLPYMIVDVSVWDDYLLNGVYIEKESIINLNRFIVLAGAFNDYERSQSDLIKPITTFSNKPFFGEVCMPTTHYCVTKTDILPIDSFPFYNENFRGIYIECIDLSQVSGTYKVNELRSLYVDVNSKNKWEFQFVNRFGVVESFFAEMMEECISEGETETYTYTAPIGFNKIGGRMISMSDRFLTYKCSTGFISKEWNDWFINEVFSIDNFRNVLKNRFWVKIKDIWMPCSIKVEEELTVYNKKDANMMSIEFEVLLNTNVIK